MNFLQKEQGSNFTMIGCLSTHSRQPYVEIHKTTSKECVLLFLANYLPHHKGAVLIMDNHQAHKSRELRNLCVQNEVQLLYLPSISSTLNPIERLWSLAKSRFAKELLLREVRPRGARALMQEVIRGIEESKIEGILRSSHRTMMHILEGHMS